jgi:hypothetical protein
VTIFAYDWYCSSSVYKPQLVLDIEGIHLMLVKSVWSQEKRDVNVDDVDIELDKMFWTWDWNRYADRSHDLFHARSELKIYVKH